VACSTAFCETLAFPPDSPRWDLQGRAKVDEYLGRKCLSISGGAAVLKDFEMRDAVVDVDVATSTGRGFVGFFFRVSNEGAFGEEVYLRPHKTGLPDAMQYTPVLNTGRNWQIYNGPGFTGAVNIPSGEWYHVRLEVRGAQAKLFVKDMDKPALEMDDLKSGVERGEFALFVLTGDTRFSNFQIQKLPDSKWLRHIPPMAANMITKWSLSPVYDALARNLERPLSTAEIGSIAWQEVEAEAPGFVLINRFRESPHPRVTFETDFSKRLDPQPGTKVVYAKTIIESERDQLKKLGVGYSDDVSVFLNGKILYRGRSAQGFREPGYLGIVTPDDDALYLPLKAGKNELVLAVSELGGGSGFICRLEDVKE